MRKIVLTLVAIAAALLVAVPASGKTVGVQIQSTGFNPATVTVRAGDVVRWTNTDTSRHQVVADNGSFKSPVLQPNDSWTYQVAAPGTYGYHGGINPALKGKLVVKQAAAVSINPSQSAVTFGNKVRLSGNVSSGQSGQQVTLRARGCSSQSLFLNVGTFTTQAFGAWFFSPTPLQKTTYKVLWNGVSSTTTVNVRPKLVLRHLGGRRFSVNATVFAQKFYRRYVLIQRFTSTHGWVNVGRVHFRIFRAAAHQYRTSSATFRLSLRHGLALRANFPQSQVGGCYLRTVSNTVRS
jgi:plastocyanin